MPIGAEPRAVALFFETAHLLREHLGVNTTCGASNTWFGMPLRHTLSAHFLAIASSHGLTSAIMDARSPECVEALRAADVLCGARRVRRRGSRPTAAQPGAGGGDVSAAAEDRPRRPARTRPRPPALPRHRRDARPQRDARAGRHHGLRRGELERHRHRLDLRRPRHLQEVQRAHLGAPSPSRAWTRARSRRTSSETAGGSPAARRRPEDLLVEVPPLQTRPKAALAGVGRHVILRPASRSATWSSTSRRSRTRRSDLERVLEAMDDLDLQVELEVVRRLPRTLRSADWDVTAVIVDDRLIDVEPGDTTHRRFALAFDLGTTTVVANLIDLETGQPAAVRSMLNLQQPFGADVISRISATMTDPNALDALRARAHETLAELAHEVCEAATSRRARSTRSSRPAT